MTEDLFAADLKVGIQAQTIALQASEEPEARAMRRVKDVLLAGHPAVVAFSSGKDSSTLAGIVLNAARAVIEAGRECPPIVVLHGNTGVEQPEIVDLAESEIERMRDYAKKHGIPLEARINSPTLNASFPVRVIGGRALPSFPDSRADCSTKCSQALFGLDG